MTPRKQQQAPTHARTQALVPAVTTHLPPPPPPADITEMQAKAILEAAVNVSAKGIKAHPHIMVPLVGFEEELANQVGGRCCCSHCVVHHSASAAAAAAGVQRRRPRSRLWRRARAPCCLHVHHLIHLVFFFARWA